MKTTIYQLERAMRDMARNDAPLEAKMQTIIMGFESFMPQIGCGTDSIESYAGEGGEPVTVTYRVDSDGDACDLRVFGDQSEITKYLDCHVMSRLEEECNAASRAALQEELDQCAIDNYEADQEYA